MPTAKLLRALIHYLLAGMAGLFFLLVVFTGLVYYLAVSDQQRVPELVERTCREELGVEATFSHYRFQYLDYFPFLSLALEDVAMRNPSFEAHGRELLHVDRVSVLFRPWKILRREFVVKTVVVENARIELYRTAGGSSNTYFLDSLLSQVADETSRKTNIFSIDKVQIDGLHFDFLDSLRGKHHHFEMLDSRITFNRQLDTNFLHIQGDWLFQGLTFKFKNGAFLHQKKAAVDLRVAAVRKDNLIEIQPSSLNIAGNPFQLRGFLKPRGDGYIKLDLRSSGIRLSEARALLAENLREALQPYDVDQPIRTHFVLEGPLTPGQPPPIDLRFSVTEAVFATPDLEFTDTRLEGRYINNCDSTGRITPHSDCLTFDYFSGRLFDRFPFQGSYRAHDLQDPKALVEGQSTIPLEELNQFLSPGQFALHKGQADLQFTYEGTPRDLTADSIRRLQMQLDGTITIRDAALSYLPGPLRFDRINGHWQFDESDLMLKQLRFQFDETPFTAGGVIHDLLPLVFNKENRLRARLDLQTPHLNFDPFLKKTNASFSPEAEGSASPGDPAAPKVARVVQRLSNALDASIRVKAEKISYRKLEASDVRLRIRIPRACRRSDGGWEKCLTIDQLSGRIFDGIPVEGDLRLYQLDDPQLQMNLRMATPLHRLSGLVPADKLDIQEGQLKLNLQYQGPLDHYFDLDQALLSDQLRGEVHIEQAALRYLPGNYRLRSLNAKLTFDQKDLHIDSLSLSVNQNDIRARGKVLRLLPFVLNGNQPLQTVLEVETPKLNLNHFSTPETEKIKQQQKNTTSTPVAKLVEAAIDHLGGRLQVKADTLQYQHIQLTRVTFDSRFTDHCEGRQERDGCIVVDTLSARLFGSAPLEASLRVQNLRQPLFDIKGRVAMPLADLNTMFSTGQIEFFGGWVNVEFRYEGQITGQKDPERALLDARFSGQAGISDADFDFKPRGYRFRRVNADFNFNEKDLQVERLELLLNDNPLRAGGRFFDFPSFVLLPDRPLQANLRIQGSNFDLGKFRSPPEQSAPLPSADFEATPVTEVVNAALSNLETALDVHFDTIRYRQFLARDLSGHLRMNADRVAIDEATMALAGGRFQLGGSIYNLQCNHPYIDIQAGFQQTDIQGIFQAFENFGQKDLTADNIRGRLTGNINFQARADAHYDLQPASMRGQFDLKVVDGALLRLPALMDINGFIFKNRNMDAVKFATLENAFNLQGRDLHIDHFFVVSNVLTFGVEGIYSLGDLQGTDLLFEVPLANIFHRNFDVDSMDGMEDRLRGLSILLRATEEAGNLKFKLVFSRNKAEKPVEEEVPKN